MRLRIGFSFQNSALYDSMNVYQNLAFPLTMNNKGISTKDVDEAVKAALEDVGLFDKLNQMPLDYQVGGASELVLHAP